MGLSWESFFQMVPHILAPDWLKQCFRPIRGQDKVGDIVGSPVFRWYLEILACDWLKQGRYHLKNGLLSISICPIVSQTLIQLKYKGRVSD